MTEPLPSTDHSADKAKALAETLASLKAAAKQAADANAVPPPQDASPLGSFAEDEKELLANMPEDLEF